MHIDAIWKPRLFAGEQNLFESELRRTRALLEYGMGGSTVSAIDAGIPRIVSIDSDFALVQIVRQRIDKNAAHVQLLHCDIGRVEE